MAERGATAFSLSPAGSAAGRRKAAGGRVRAEGGPLPAALRAPDLHLRQGPGGERVSGPGSDLWGALGLGHWVRCRLRAFRPRPFWG